VLELRIHDLRHVHATLSVWSGVDPKTIQKRLGHSSLHMTLGLYSHAVLDADRQLARRLNDIIADQTAHD
jgi:integrase